MSEISFDFEWTDPMGARGSELRATWARLQILVDGEPITRLVDHETRSVRASIDLPLYPIADWFATYWWFLLSEVETPGKIALEEYARRHNIRFAQEGFALPDLTIQPLGQRIGLKWDAALRKQQRLEFISRGAAFVDADEFRQNVGEFISAVVSRLDEMQVGRTDLADEWSTIAALDPDEVAFCEASASLGVEPFAAPPEVVESILAISNALPASVLADFLSIASLESASTEAEKVLDSIHVAETNTAEVPSLIRLRADLRGMPEGRSPRPWQQGYEYARVLRSNLGLDGASIGGAAGFKEVFELDDQGFKALIQQLPEQPKTVDAVVGFNASGSPTFTIGPRPEEALLFASCRSLFEYLSSVSSAPKLVTRALTDDQKRNRAFAAEFLAPAEALRAVVRSDSVSEESVDDLAATFGVSSFVVRHQLENHRIAAVEAT